MKIAHLTASSFIGGLETQILGLIGHLPLGDELAVLSFSEGGRCRPFLDRARALGAEAVELRENAPRYRAAAREVAGHLRRLGADVLCCHGYKPDILGLFAARAAGVPAVAVAHGWTAATWKVRLNESVDRLCLRGMDRVVCVSESQARKVRRAGVPGGKVEVVRNAVDPSRYEERDPAVRRELAALFPEPPRVLVGSAGRLSPEKGHAVLVEAAGAVLKEEPGAGFVVFGEGPLRAALEEKVRALGLGGRFVFAGFRSDLNRVLPHLDVFALPSFTEGLPVVALEAFAAGVPVVAATVGGTPEVVNDPDTGRLVPPGDPRALALALAGLVRDPGARAAAGAAGRAIVLDRFTFAAQAPRYRAVFESVSRRRPALTPARVR
jgi:glycosyltransferase involved in cell wall biosynthesis